MFDQILVGLSVFERQVKMCLAIASSIPELSGIQFIKVLRDNAIDPKQNDPLEFVVFLTILQIKVISAWMCQTCFVKGKGWMS